MKYKLSHYIQLAILGLLWGPSFMFIKVALDSFLPIEMVFFRVITAILFLGAILIIKKRGLPKQIQEWKSIFIVAFFANAFPFFLFAYGEQEIDSAVAAIINATVPIFTLIIAHFFIENERLTRSKVIGIVCGFIGILILCLPKIKMGAAPMMAFSALTLASISYGIGIVYARKFLMGFKAIVIPSSQMIASFFWVLPFMLFYGNLFELNRALYPTLSVFGLGIFGSGLAYIIYYRLLEETDAGFLSYSAYLFPLFGVIFGVIFLNESVSWEMILSMLFIAFGLVQLKK